MSGRWLPCGSDWRSSLRSWRSGSRFRPPFGNRRWHGRAIDNRCLRWADGSRREVRMDHISCRNRCHRSHVSGRSGTRSRDFSHEVEGGHGRRARRFFRAFLGLYCGCALRSALDCKIELARGRRALHHFRSRRLRCNVGTRPQQDGFRQSDSRRVFRQRSRHGHRARTDFFAIHNSNIDLRRCERSRVLCSAVS